MIPGGWSAWTLLLAAGIEIYLLIGEKVFIMKIKFSKQINQKRIALAVSSIALTAVTLIMEGYTQRFVDAMTFQPLFFGGLLIAYFFLSVLRYIKEYLKTSLEKNGNLEGQAQAVKNVLGREYAFFEKTESGALLYHLTSDMYEWMPWQTHGQLQLILEAVNLASFCLFLFWTDAVLALAAFFLVICSLFLANYLSDRMGKYKNQQQAVGSRLNQYMLNIGKSIDTVRQLGKMSFFSQKYDDYMKEEYLPVIKKLVKSQTFFISQLIFSTEVSPFLMLFMGVILTVLGRATIGKAIIMMDLTMRIADSVQTLADFLPQKSAALEIEKRIGAVIGESASWGENNGAGLTPFDKIEVKIESYQPENSSRVLLKSTDITIERGDICTIKGVSGGGKSTLVKIIAGLKKINRQSGWISYNGQDIQTLPPTEYHKHILLVSQDTLLFPGTVKENLLMEQAAADEELTEIFQICGLESFIQQYGLDYMIENTGSNLSGGQRQRIGLARILLRRPELLILDEATSALDADTAEMVVKNVAAFARRHFITILAISHKQDFEKYSDKIIYI